MIKINYLAKTTAVLMTSALFFNCTNQESIEPENDGFTLNEEAKVAVTNTSGSNAPEVYMGLAEIKDFAERPLNPDFRTIRNHIKGVYVNLIGTGANNLPPILQRLNYKNTNSSINPNGEEKEVIFVGNIRRRDKYTGTIDKTNASTQSIYTGPYILENNFVNQRKQAIDGGYLIKEFMSVVNDKTTKNQSNPDRFFRDHHIPMVKERVANRVGNLNVFGNRFFITTRNGHYQQRVYDNSTNTNVNGTTFPFRGQAFGTLQNVRGILYERDPISFLSTQEFRESYTKAFNIAKANNKELIYLCPRGNIKSPGSQSLWFDRFIAMYDWMKNRNMYPDKIVIINYDRSNDPFPVYPTLNASKTRPAVTFTGVVYWAVQKYLGRNPARP